MKKPPTSKVTSKTTLPVILEEESKEDIKVVSFNDGSFKMNFDAHKHF